MYGFAQLTGTNLLIFVLLIEISSRFSHDETFSIAYFGYHSFWITYWFNSSFFSTLYRWNITWRYTHHSLFNIYFVNSISSPT